MHRQAYLILVIQSRDALIVQTLELRADGMLFTLAFVCEEITGETVLSFNHVASRDKLWLLSWLPTVSIIGPSCSCDRLLDTVDN